MDISPELKKWLEEREQLLKLKHNIRQDGGHIMLKATTYDPEALDEPLRSEAIQYFNRLNKMDAQANTASKSYLEH